MIHEELCGRHRGWRQSLSEQHVLCHLWRHFCNVLVHKGLQDKDKAEASSSFIGGSTWEESRSQRFQASAEIALNGTICTWPQASLQLSWKHQPHSFSCNSRESKGRQCPGMVPQRGTSISPRSWAPRPLPCLTISVAFLGPSTFSLKHFDGCFSQRMLMAELFISHPKYTNTYIQKLPKV